MRLGQTSAVHFASQLLASFAGFVATLYVARELGSAVLGTYAVFLAVLIWLRTGVGAGIHQAVMKRLSEVDGGGRELGAALLLELFGFLVVAGVLLAFGGVVDAYLGFEGAGLLGVALGVVLLYSFVSATLRGEQRVHLSALLRPVDRVVRSSIQLAVVLLGALGGGLVGLVWGYVAGAAVAAFAGLLLLSTRPKLPRREHVRSVLDFTRYSWLSGVEERAFSAMDTVVLGLFVASNLIGYYEVAWNLASLLAIFGTSITQTLFPAISELESRAADAEIGDLVTRGLAYSGLFLVPGLVGVLVVGDEVLAIYGAEFQRGSTILVILVLARLVYAYEAILVMSLNAIDRPDLAFDVNLVFVGANVVLNIVLVYRFGWYGAAVGTLLSAIVGLGLAYWLLRPLIDFSIPVGQWLRQALAAGTMGLLVLAIGDPIRTAIPGAIPEATALAGTGAAVYFAVMLAISSAFRRTVRENVPA